MKLLYVAGPYRGNVEENIANARRVSVAIWEAGHAALCPHLNTAFFNDICKAPDKAYLAGDLLMLAGCDGIVMMPGWEFSNGSCHEREMAIKLDIPIYDYPNLPEADNVNPTT